jgi:hypothetical protein
LYYKLRNTTDVTLYFESDFHTCTIGGKEGDTSYTPSKDFEKFGHKNAIKHENRETFPLHFLTTSNIPIKRI